MTLISAMCLGADCIADCDLLRAGQTRQLLGHEVAAPSTLSTFLPAFTFGMSASLTLSWGLRCNERGGGRWLPAGWLRELEVRVRRDDGRRSGD